MATLDDDEEERLRAVALQNARSIFHARRRAEETLRKQSEWLKVTLASIGDAVISTDAEARVTFMNRVAETLTGWTETEAVGRPLKDVFQIVNEWTRLPVENPAVRALEEGTVVGLANHTLLVARDGTECPIDDSAAPMRDEGGTTLGAVLVFRDVTERKRAEEDRARLAAIVQSSEDAIVSKTLDGIIRSWNAGAERLFGYPAAEAVGQPITLIVPPDRIDEERAILERLRRGEHVEHFETCRVSKDGRRIDISLTISPLRNGEGHVIGASKVARDITERKRAEAQRKRLQYEVEAERSRLDQVTAESQRRQRLYETVLSSTPDLVYVFGLDHRFTYANEALLGMWGRTWDEAIGKGFLELGYPDWHAAMHDREIDQVIATRQPIRGEVPFEGTLGRRIYEYIFVPVFGADGQVEAVAGTTRDMTERQQLEDTLRRQAEQLVEADRKKDDFIALLAHELRNPLAPVRNGLQVMRLAAGDTAAIAEARAMMERQIGHMVRLIDDLLDVSRISRNKMDLRRAPVALAEIVSNAVESARPAIEAGGHTLTVSLPAEPVLLDADLTRLAQVFSNLLTNSAKYTEPGGRISLTAVPRGGEVVVSVRDTGIGIPAEALPRVFDMFSQLDRNFERASGGLGIGLALVKGLVEMHGGTVTAESLGEGQGSTFTVRLRTMAIPSQSPSRPPEPLGAGPKRRILVVDDNEDSARSMARVLTLRGNDVRSAHDGVEAVEAAAEVRPEVILMDVGMPRLNGYEATRRIRQQPWGRSIIIIALTGWGQEGDRVQSREAGCDGHLVKPVNLLDLETLLTTLTRGEQAEPFP